MKKLHKKAARMHPINPPAEPSHVFFGEMEGAKGVFPMALPVKYAKVSLLQFMIIKPRIQYRDR